jgi:hypothetical protein
MGNSLKGIVQRKLTGVKNNKLKGYILIRRWGDGHFFILKAHRLGFCQKAFDCQKSQKY